MNRFIILYFVSVLVGRSDVRGRQCPNPVLNSTLFITTYFPPAFSYYILYFFFNTYVPSVACGDNGKTLLQSCWTLRKRATGCK